MSTDQQPQAAAAPPRPETSLVTSCHCQRIQVRLPSTPKILNECRCTVCYKYGALWAYYPRPDVKISVADGARIEPYVRADGDGDIQFNRCSHCGCMTHWWGLGPYGGPEQEMGVNCRLLPEEEADGIERKIERC